MSCTSPCLGCISNNFYACSSCDTSLNSSYTLSGSQCIVTPTWYIQLACTCFLFIFVLLPLIRKRSMVLTKLLDIIQTVAYFKYINAFIYYRDNYLYLDMRSMSPWSEGWQLLTLSGDLVTPIFLTEQTYVNKLIRIASIWVGIILLVLLVGVLKICCKEGKLEFSTYASKNIANAVCIAFYVTIQDIAFYCAANFFGFSLSTTMSLIFFVTAVILALAALILIIWQFYVINFKYQDQKQKKLYNYEVMFMYRMDYDLFNTYSLTHLPETQKKIFRYSNLALIDILRKIGYSFLIISYLYSSTTISAEIYSLLGYIVFFQILWYIALPFDPRKQIIQLLINIIGDLIMLALLLIPIFVNSSNYNFIYFILCLSLFGLAVFSALFEIFLDLYTMIPYDLYNLGLKIVIQDKELRQELNRRKRQMEENQRKIRELKDEHERLLDQLKKQKESPVNKTDSQLYKTISKKPTIKRQNQSQVDFSMNPPEKGQPMEKISELTNEQLVYPIESGSDNGEQNPYKIDTMKKRQVYAYNKKNPFVYSNKVQQ